MNGKVGKATSNRVMSRRSLRRWFCIKRIQPSPLREGELSEGYGKCKGTYQKLALWEVWLDREDEGQWCRRGLERKGWLANYTIVRRLDFALNAIEVLEGFKQRSDIWFMFIKYPFDCCVETRLNEEMGKSDGYSTRNNRDFKIDRRERLSWFFYQLFPACNNLFPLYIKSIYV